MLRKFFEHLKMAFFEGKPDAKRLSWLLPWIILPIFAAIVVGGIAYAATTKYFMSRAELNIQNLLLSQRGLHLYIQRVMHPTYFKAMKDGNIAHDYYAPQILSSSYIVRVYHGFTNEERVKLGLNELYYKLAADNPRNPVNKADEFESRLIRLFNEQPNLKEYRGVLEKDGKKYLFSAAPFLETNDRCLKCHGDRKDAPEGLQNQYPGGGGFGDKVGKIRAVEYIRVPIRNEMTAIYVTTAATTSGFLTLGFFAIFNKRLRNVVRARTTSLEAEVAERKTAQTSLELFKNLLDHSTDAIFVINPQNGQFLDVNETACRNLGYSREELLARRTEDICEPGTNESCWKTLVMQLSNHGQGVIRTRHKRKDGTLFPVEVSSKYIEHENGCYILAITHDLSEREKLEEQLRHAQKMEAIGTFTGGVAHDFNNILTAILGYANLLQAKLPDNETCRQYADSILHSTERAASLTQSLLIFSRKQRGTPSYVELNSLVRKCEKLLRRIVPETIGMETSYAESSLPIYVDSGQIEQVLMNLVSNARDALPNGGDITIKVERVELDGDLIDQHIAAKPGSYALISVSDNGCGMDATTQQRIFEPFFTTKEIGKGTGLGLSIVYGIIEEYHGYILCQSNPDNGTLFKIYLPLSESLMEHEKDVTVKQLPCGTETVLLAEDDHDVRAIDKAILEEYGYTVIEACDGEDAVGKYRVLKDRVQIVVLDAIMPKKSGIEVYKELLTINPSVKVIITSGYSSDMLDIKAFDNMNLFYLQKPLLPILFLQTMRKVLENNACQN